MVEIFIGASDKPITSREEWLAAHEIHPDDAAAVRAAYDAHLEGLTPRFEIEYRVRRPGGEWRWVHTRARCVRDSEGNPVNVGSGSDHSRIAFGVAHARARVCTQRHSPPGRRTRYSISKRGVRPSR